MSVNLVVSCNDAYDIVSEILNLLPTDSKGQLKLNDLFPKNVASMLNQTPEDLLAKDKDGLVCSLGSLLSFVNPAEMLCTKNPGQCTGSGCTGLTKGACEPQCQWVDSSCVKLSKTLIGGAKDFLGKDHCGPSFCGDPSGNKMYTIPLGSCDNLKGAVQHLLSGLRTALEEYKAKIPNPIASKDQKFLDQLSDYLVLDKLCSQIEMFTPEEAAGILSVVLPNFLASALTKESDTQDQKQKKDALVATVHDLLDKLNMSAAIKCLCPSAGTSGKPVVAKQPPPPRYNMRMVGLLALILLVVALLPVILVAVFVHPRKTKIVSLIVTITIIIVIFLILVFANPVCILKPCPIASDQWVELSGMYEGKSAKIAGVEISIKLETSSADNGQEPWKSQRAKIVSLGCQDTIGACPAKNLLSKCGPNDTSVTLGDKEVNGYPLEGGCINSMYEFTGSTNKQTILGIWAVREGSKVLVQILANIAIKGALELQKYILVELHKTS